MLLESRTAIITGAANGIGRAIAQDFLNEGASVIGLDIDERTLTALSKLKFKDRAFRAACVDIRDRNAVEKFFVSDVCEGASILVNNAGIEREFRMDEPDYHAWDAVTETNLRGTMLVTSQFLANVLRGNIRQASIVFVTSVHTAQAFPHDAPYDASKHALVGLMRSVALDYASCGVRANAVAPGCIYPTNITERMGQEEAKQLGYRIPIGRTGHPNEIAHVCAFLASEMASYVTGAEIRVDGGLAIKNPLLP